MGEAKRRKQLDSGWGKPSELNRDDWEAVVEVLHDLPRNWWKLLCKTKDQLQHFYEVEEDWNLLYIEVKSYFEGTESPLGDLDSGTRERFNNLLHYYLHLYNFIRAGWKYIEKEAFDTPLAKFIGSTPGKTLIAILEQDCWGEFCDCFKCVQWSRDTIRRHYAQGKKLEPFLHENLKPGSAIANKVENYIAKEKQISSSVLPHGILTIFCINACSKYISQDRNLKQELKRLEVYLRMYTDQQAKNLADSIGWDGQGRKMKVSSKGWTYT